MADNLPFPFSAGPITYNGLTFNSAYKARCSMRPVYTNSGRNVSYVEYTLTVDSVITSTECFGLSPGESPSKTDTLYSTDGGMTAARSRLLVEGGELIAKNIGFGFDIHIPKATQQMPYLANISPAGTMIGGQSDSLQAARRVDVKYGPKPQVLDWEPIGGARACRIHWEVDFALTTCTAGDLTDIGQFEWGMDWGIAENGLTTRTISGELVVASQSNGQSILNDSDRYREAIANRFPLMNGFTRTQAYRISEDQSTLFFSISDTEIDSGNEAYHPGVIQADVSHDTSSMSRALISTSQWTSSLAGTITVKPYLSKKVAWLSFLRLFYDRVNYLLDGTWVAEGLGQNYRDNEKLKQTVKDRAFVITGLSISEPIYGRDLSFSVTWRYLLPLKLLMEKSGHFQPLDDGKGDWNLWKTSIADIQGPRGWKNLKFDRSRVAILGFCKPGTSFAESEQGKQPIQQRPSRSEPLLTGNVTAEGSYMDWKNSMEVDEEDGAVYQLLQKDPTRDPFQIPYSMSPTQFRRLDGGQVTRIINQSDSSSQYGQEGPGMEGEEDTEENDVILYRRGNTHFRVILQGSATRVGRAAPIPALHDWGGASVQLVRRKVSTAPIGRAGEVIWRTRWRIEYKLNAPARGDISSAGSPLPEAPRLVGGGPREGLV